MPRDDDDRDERDGEKPRRKRDKADDRYERDEDDRPRRRRDRDRDDYEQPKEVSVLGIISLVKGIGALISSFVPCVGFIAIGVGAFGLLLGAIGWIVAGRTQRQGVGLPIAGVVVNSLAIIIGCCWLFLLAAMFKDVKVPPPVEEGDTIAIAARELDQEFEDNEVAADAKYKNRTLEVTGKVERVTRDDKPGKITVELSGVTDSTVDCHFDKWDRDRQVEIGKLTVGDEVTIRGTCKGKVREFVTMDRCSIVRGQETPKPDPKKPADPPTAITAEDLDKAYKENAIGADAEYKNKTLEVTGKFARIARNKPGKVTVEIEGSEFETIDCDFNASDQGQLGKLAAGDVLVIRGTCRGEVDGTITLNTCTLVKTLEKPSARPPIVVTADALSKAYESNSVSADAKYKGKYLEISGTVLRVGQRPPNKITVDIGTEDRFMLQCDFLAKDGKAALENVSAGDKIVIRGICRGNAPGVVMLEECTIPKNDGAPKKNVTPKKKP